MKRILSIFIFLTLFLTLAIGSDLLANNTVRLHTGQTASFETQAGEDGDIDGAGR